MTFDAKRGEFNLLIGKAKVCASQGEQDPTYYKEAFESLLEAMKILADSCEHDFNYRLDKVFDTSLANIL
ncbi:hypothetical protein SAMN04244572_04900 [Azotobacter beijerinckii]|uniref:Uncharacterized protein n=1 Tax=Azotobacter beijerinckii TaxID=170623 RepID=A0A1H7AS42_9GAMM|nr:hypothetical protein [Azotobacter beijerinckii]SEJ68419.1 hypothetical protein SAMN04244572_04900 [Azotobacter beijerinckii]SER74856.1 hypothetical protein SAMN04244573_04227 [Azotobacter beijerinckii]